MNKLSGERDGTRQWQSVMMVDTDGPRERKVGIQALGFR